MNWQFLIGHPVSSAAASNQSIHSIHPVHHHSRHHQVIHNDVVDDDEVLIIKFHSPFIISIYEPLSRIEQPARCNMINIIMKSFFSQISVSIYLLANTNMILLKHERQFFFVSNSYRQFLTTENGIFFCYWNRNSQ